MLLSQIKDGLKQVREFVKKDTFPPVFQKHFAIQNWENLVLINYRDSVTYEFGADDWTPAMRVCRGIIITKDGSQIVSFPFHKFFNVGEGSETFPQIVAKWNIRAVTEKLDGIMLQIFRWKGELIWASRHAIWSYASVDAYKIGADAIKRIFPQKGNWTLICELIHPSHRKPGMIDYKGLIAIGLLYLRNLDTLELIPAVEKFENDLPDPLILPQQYLVRDFWEARGFVQSSKTRYFEGVVLQGSEELGNFLVKIKNPLYLEAIATIRQVNPMRLVGVYERDGLEGVNAMLSLYRDILDDVPDAKRVKQILEEAEYNFTKQCLELRQRDLNEIPQHLRWVKTYEVGSEKWNKTLWRFVANEVRRQLKERQ